jgi:hypothetical protein
MERSRFLPPVCVVIAQGDRLRAVLNTADLVGALDWLQHRLAEHAGSPEALAVLAEQGRTSRIRNTACSRLYRRPG